MGSDGDSTFRWWLAVLSYAVVAAALGAPIGPGAAGIGVAAGAAILALALHVVLHELGHLLVALALRLPVVRVQISLLPGRRNMVSVRPSLAARALPARMAAFGLGGPLVTAGGTAVTFELATRTVPPLVACALVGATVTGALLAVTNLWPQRLRGGRRTDGLHVLRWTFQPGRSRRELARQLRAERNVGTIQAIERGDLDGARLDAVLDDRSTDPLVLLAAVERRWFRTGVEDDDRITGQLERLTAFAFDKRTDRATAGLIAAWLAFRAGLGYLRDVIVRGKPLDRARDDHVIELSALAARLAPGAPATRIGLAVTGIVSGRPSDARHLLTDARDMPDSELKAAALQVRAVAEIYLGDPVEAGRLAAAAGDGEPELRDILAALRTRDTPDPSPSRGTS